MKPKKTSLTLMLACALACTSSHIAFAQEQPGESAQVAAEGAKTVELLKQLIRIDTSNAPGDTTALANFLKTQFAPLGADITIVTAPNGKASHFIARIKGDGSKKPILLAAHADVVPVERDKWTVEPFAGVEKDGFVFGRGAMDFKGGMAVFARAVMRLAEQKVPLSRDVIFLAEADEEQGAYNTSWLAKDHWDKIDAEFALNEGGYVMQDEKGIVRQVNVTTADKVTVVLRLRTKGPVGHPSRPLPPSQTAGGKMIAALGKVSVYDTRIKLVPQVRSYLAALAKENPGRMASDIQVTLDGAAGASANPADAVAKARSEQDMLNAKPSVASRLHALMRDTMTITMFSSGKTANVIPGEAEAIVDVRMLPGTTTDQMIEEIRSVIGDPSVSVDIASPASVEATQKYFRMRSSMPASSISTDLYKAIEVNAKKLWPQADVVPALFEAGTDAIAWRERGVPVYGIYPYPLDDDILRGMHGHDERISVRSLHQGTDWIFKVLADVAGK